MPFPWSPKWLALMTANQVTAGASVASALAAAVTGLVVWLQLGAATATLYSTNQYKLEMDLANTLSATRSAEQAFKSA